MKFEVQIFGKVPDSIEIEADNAENAEALALGQIIEELTFEAEPVRPGPCLVDAAIAAALADQGQG